VKEFFSVYALAFSDFFVFKPISESTYGASYATSDALEVIFFRNLTSSNCPDNNQLSCAIRDVASAMTKTIRDTAFTGNVSNEPPRDYGTSTLAKKTTAGRTMVTATYISIHWRWLVLPVAVWVLGAVSCLCSAWCTHHAHIQTWMHSVLPLAIRLNEKDTPNFEGQNCSDSGVEDRVANGQNAETGDAGRYARLLCYDESLEQYVKRAKRTQARLEVRNFSQ
jgi:hypothetical protein